MLINDEIVSLAVMTQQNINSESRCRAVESKEFLPEVIMPFVSDSPSGTLGLSLDIAPGDHMLTGRVIRPCYLLERLSTA